MTLSPTLTMYRNLLAFAKRLPAQKREESVKKIKEEFRRHSSEHDKEKVDEMLKHASSTLGYLKIVTPKRAKEQTGHTKIVFGDPTKPTKAMSNWTGTNMDPDSVARHYRTLKRAGFTDNKSVTKGMF